MDNQENQKKNTRLGQGLKAFFGEDLTSDDDENAKIIQIRLNDINLANWQPRKQFDAIDELAQSIKIHGIVQPILVKKLENNKYELIAGERRFRAAQTLNLNTIPAIVNKINAQEALEISMIENLQRKDLNPIEKAEGFAFLIEKLNLNQEELAQRLGMNRSVIANFLRINSLPEDIKDEIRNGKISAGHAKLLVNKANALDLAKDIIKNKLSVRQIEEKLKTKKEWAENEMQVEQTEIQHKEKKREISNEMERFQEMISNTLGVRVRIDAQKNAGVIMLEFANLKELESIISSICLK